MGLSGDDKVGMGGICKHSTSPSSISTTLFIEGRSLGFIYGDKDPNSRRKFVFTLIEGLREISVTVWNSNTIASDVFIGSGKVQLQKVLSQGYDDTAWPLQTRGGRNAGEMKSILHYPNALKPETSFALSTPPHVTQRMPQVPLYYNPVPTTAAPYPHLAPAAP
ncbi:hypothetical protein SLA2020_303000 [Shorea laevis]